MSDSTYFLVTAVFLICMGLLGVLQLPKIIRQRVASGDIPKGQAWLGPAIRIVGVLLCLLGSALVVMEILYPLAPR